MTDFATAHALRIIRARNAVIEIALEQALQNGKHGVLVVEEPDMFFAEIHEGVPYGRLLRFPSRKALDLWTENGRPL